MARFDEELARTRNVGLQERSQFLPEGIGRPTATGEAIARPEGVSDVLARPGFDPSGAIRPSAAAQEFLARKAPELERGTAKIRLREQQQADEARAAKTVQQGEQAELQHQRELEVTEARFGAPARIAAFASLAKQNIQSAGDLKEAVLAGETDIDVANIKDVGDSLRSEAKLASEEGRAQDSRNLQREIAKVDVMTAFKLAEVKGEIVGTPQQTVRFVQQIRQAKAAGAFETLTAIQEGETTAISTITTSSAKLKDKMAAIKQTVEEFDRMKGGVTGGVPPTIEATPTTGAEAATEVIQTAGLESENGGQPENLPVAGGVKPPPGHEQLYDTLKAARSEGDLGLREQMAWDRLQKLYFKTRA